MTTVEQYSFETLALHKNIPDEAGTSVQSPIHQTAAYVFKDTQQAANLFALKEFGEIYSRLTNPTVGELVTRLATLHGGGGGFATSSGHAAQFLTLLNLLRPGDHIVASRYLYGGTHTQLTHNFPNQFGWNSSLVDIDSIDKVKSAITEKTKAIFVETQANPNGILPDVEALAKVAGDNGIPLIVDNTIATPYLFNPIKYGANIVIYSLTKYISSNGAIIGGAVIDGANFDWGQNDKFPLLTKPDASYNDISFYETFKNLAFTVRGIAVGLRDIGATLSPNSAWLAIQGLETLSVRLDRFVQNGKIVSEFLNDHPKVSKVNFPALDNSPYKSLSDKYFAKGHAPVFTIELKGGYEAGKNLVEKTKLFTHCANIGDARSLIIHPSSTTHAQLSSKHKQQVEISDGLVRLSIGLEDANDLIRDLEQALA